MRPVVQTTSGAVRGLDEHTFLGIPYASARRFQPPEPAFWTGIREASAFGSACAQPNFLGEKPPGISFCCLGSEDCLHLNIWTPSLHPKELLPVVIFVHGGAFQIGSNSHPSRTGQRFCGVRDMVYISINYRLGVLGGLYLGGALGEDYASSGSHFALDARMAIQWVKANAAAFGGDPERITLLGISAGAKLIGALLTMPESTGLFQQVWLESGATQAFRGGEKAEQVTRDFMAYLPGKTPWDLLELPVEELIRAQAQLCSCPYSTGFFGPVLDDGVFSSGWQKRWEEGQGWKGRAVLGSCRQEMYGEVRRPDFEARAREILTGYFGEEGARAALSEVRAQKAANPSRKAAEIWTQVYSDFMYRSHTDRLAYRLLRQEDQVWLYSFEFWPASHGMGMHYIMGMEEEIQPPIEPERLPAAHKVASFLNHSVRHFICCGTPQTSELPEWKPLEGNTSQKLFFAEHPSLHAVQGDTLESAPEYQYPESE